MTALERMTVDDWRSGLERLYNHPTVVRLRRFVAVGAAAAGLQTALLWGLVELGGLHYLLAAVVSIETTIVLQYVANNAWTFTGSSHSAVSSYLVGLAKTNLVRGTAIPIQTGLLWALVTHGGIGYLIANVGAIFVSGFYRYYLDSRWTWSVG